MRPVSGGKLAGSTASPPHTSTTSAIGRRAPPRAKQETARRPVMATPPLRLLELYLRRRLRAFACGEFRHRLIRAEEGRRPQQAGEGLERRVVDPHRLDVVAPRPPRSARPSPAWRSPAPWRPSWE